MCLSCVCVCVSNTGSVRLWLECNQVASVGFWGAHAPFLAKKSRSQSTTIAHTHTCRERDYIIVISTDYFDIYCPRGVILVSSAPPSPPQKDQNPLEKR